MIKKFTLFFLGILLTQLSFAGSIRNVSIAEKPIGALTGVTTSTPIFYTPTIGTISITTSNGENKSYVRSLNTIYSCNNGSPYTASTFYIYEKFATSINRTLTFTVTAPSDFEVATGTDNYYSNVITAPITKNASNITSPSIKVRVKSNVTGTPSGTITITSSDGATFNLGVNAVVMDKPTATANDGYAVAANSNVTISVTATFYPGSTKTINWYTSSTGGTAKTSGGNTINSSAYTTSTLTSTTIYYAYISEKLNNVTCAMTDRIPVKAYVGPSIASSSATLTGFTTCENTASSNKSFTVNGTGVSATVTVTAPNGYEVSKTAESGYASTITVTANNQIITNATIYTRLSGAVTGTLTGSININGGGTLSKTITVSGTVSAMPASPTTFDNIRYGSGSITLSATVSPGATADWYNALTSGTGTLLKSASLIYEPTVTQTTNFYVVARTTAGNCLSAARSIVTATVGSQITVSTNALSAFTTCENKASTAKSFTVSGAGIIGTITIIAPSNFEISKTLGSGYAASITLTASSNTVANTTIYARLKSDATGTTTGTITLVSAGASTKNITVTGTVNLLPIATAVTGTGNGTNKINIGVTVLPEGTADWYTSSTTTSIIPGATGTLSYTTPYLKTTTHYWALARNASTGCVAVSRTNVTASVSPIITSATNSLTGFNTCYGSNSEPQKFKFSASGLTGSLTLVPSTGYEVSFSYKSDFASSLTIAPSAYAKIEEKEVYVRLTGTISGTVTGTITISATDATSKTISLTGTVSEATVAGTISYTIDRSGFATLTLIGYKGDDFKWEESEHKRGRSEEVEGKDDYRDHDEEDDDEKKHNENFHEHEDGENHHGTRVENTNTITRTITKSKAYRVTVRNGNCKAEATPTAIATYRATPYPPIGYDNARTSPGSVTISATVDVGETVDWYETATSTTALASNTVTYTTDELTTTTSFYAESRVLIGGVTSKTRTAVTATVGAPFAISVTGNRSDYIYVKLTALSSTASPTTYSWSGGTEPNSATNKFYNSGNYTVYATANGETVSKTITVTIYVLGVTKYGEITENSPDLVNLDGETNTGLPVNYEGKLNKKKADYLNVNIGDAYGGGILAYVFQPGDPGYVAGQNHGLIVATEHFGPCIWGPSLTITGTSSNLNSGANNTTLIYNALHNDLDYSTYAVSFVKNYSGGGYNDWFLPSTDELDKLNNATIKNNIGYPFAISRSNWSSTTVDRDNANAEYFYSNGSGAIGSDPRIAYDVLTAYDNRYYVIPMRKF